MNISCELNNSNFNEFVLEKIQDKLERKDVDKISRVCLFFFFLGKWYQRNWAFQCVFLSCDITDLFKETILYKDEIGNGWKLKIVSSRTMPFESGREHSNLEGKLISPVIMVHSLTVAGGKEEKMQFK